MAYKNLFLYYAGQRMTGMLILTGPAISGISIAQRATGQIAGNKISRHYFLFCYSKHKYTASTEY
ncbi:hypothetical protein [Niabella ginsenosidivorans]|uniref:hypothetical protein n=1 Tax=Niabella ginsenosidivorans TaxID=1176587 RepID=UPI0012EE540F|nr:hypothetical protein [Niabella ginsenosidivorans]